MDQKSKKVKDEQALENKCPACRASIKFNPKVGKFNVNIAEVNLL